MPTLTIALDKKSVDDKILPMLPNKNQHSVYNQLSFDPDLKYVYWALELGLVNGNLPELMAEGGTKFKQQIEEWKPQIDKEKNKQEQEVRQRQQEKEKKENNLKMMLMKRQLNSFIKTVATVIFKIQSISGNTKPKMVLDEIRKHHQEITERELNPILNALGIYDLEAQKRVRTHSWKIFYENKVQQMPSILVTNDSTLESAAAYAGAIKYQNVLFIGGNMLSDTAFRKHLEDSMRTIENNNAKDDEENEGISAEDSIEFFRELLPMALGEIYKEISPKLSAM